MSATHGPSCGRSNKKYGAGYLTSLSRMTYPSNANAFRSPKLISPRTVVRYQRSSASTPNRNAPRTPRKTAAPTPAQPKMHGQQQHPARPRKHQAPLGAHLGQLSTHIPLGLHIQSRIPCIQPRLKRDLINPAYPWVPLSAQLRRAYWGLRS